MKVKKVLIAGLATLGLVCGTFGLGAMSSAEAEAVFSEISIAEQYDYKSSFTAPEATVEVNGKSYDAEAFLVYPDGKMYVAADVVLNQEGVYKVQYRAVVDGEVYSIEEDFEVERNLFSVTSDKSSVEYDTYVISEHDPDGIGPAGMVAGVNVSLAKGDVLNYNRVVDVSDCTFMDVIMAVSPTPETIGVEEVNTFNIRLTDAYDPSMVLNIRYNGMSESVITYVASSVYGPVVGNEAGFSLHVNDGFGTPFVCAFDGRDTGSTMKKDACYVVLDYDKKQLWTAPDHKMVCDYDDEYYFSKLWSGFTTGEVFISVSSDEYQSESNFNFTITKILNHNLRNVNSTFEKEDPEIVVDTQDYTLNTLPSGVIGEKYPIFNATCKNAYQGILDVTPHVYVNYGTANQYEVYIEDNAFVPKHEGTYYLVYRITEHFGNIVEKVVPINILGTMVDMEIELDTFVEGGIAGCEMEIAMPKVSNALGMVDVKAYVEKDGERTLVQNGTYKPQKAGVYSIVYLATDYCGRTETYSYDVTIESGNKALFENMPQMPRYMVSGKTYQLPEIYAKNYTNGSGIAVPTNIKVSDANGENYAQGTLVTPQVANDGDNVTITYIAELSGKETATYSYQVPVIKAMGAGNVLNLDKFWYSVDGNSEISFVEDAKKSKKLTVSTAMDSTVDFVNAILTTELELKFNVAKANAKFSVFSIWLTDTQDPTNRLKFSYIKGSKNVLSFYVNDNIKEIFETEQVFDGTTVTFSYSSSPRSQVTYDAGKTALYVGTTYDGKEFKGFTDYKAYLSIELEGVEERSSYVIDTLSRHKMTTSKYEFVSPEIAILGEYGGMHALGSTYMMEGAIGCDIIDAVTSMYVSVIDPSRQFVTSKDGHLLNMFETNGALEMVLDQIGDYYVTYTAKDGSDNEKTFTYTVTVSDKESPEIELDGKISKNGTINKKITLPKPMVSDNIDKVEDIRVTIFVENPLGELTIIEGNSLSFTPNMAGVYVVTYWAEDLTGNVEILEYKIVVNK